MQEEGAARPDKQVLRVSGDGDITPVSSRGFKGTMDMQKGSKPTYSIWYASVRKRSDWAHHRPTLPVNL